MERSAVILQRRHALDVAAASTVLYPSTEFHVINLKRVATDRQGLWGSTPVSFLSGFGEFRMQISSEKVVFHDGCQQELQFPLGGYHDKSKFIQNVCGLWSEPGP